MACDQGVIQPDVVILLTTSPQESMGRKNAISPQFEDEDIQQRLWDTFHQECLWEGVTKLNYHPLLRPHESRKALQGKLLEALKTQKQPDQWNTYGRHQEYARCVIWKLFQATTSNVYCML